MYMCIYIYIHIYVLQSKSKHISVYISINIHMHVCVNQHLLTYIQTTHKLMITIVVCAQLPGSSCCYF